MAERRNGGTAERRNGGTAERRNGGTAERRNGGTAERRNGEDDEDTSPSQACPQISRMMPYERFDAWRYAHELALELYRATDDWPRTERFELTAQLRRAALSIPTNIAEGVAKRGSREFRRYLGIALGSLSEVSYLLLFARDRGLLAAAEWEHLDSLRNTVGRITWGLLRSLKEGR